MTPKFNINRPKVTDEEIEKNKDFETLVKQFKEQSIKKARGDESWRKNKLIRYATVIAGITVVCTVTYLSITNSNKQSTTHDKITTKQNQQITQAKGTKINKTISAPSKDLTIGYTSYKVNNNKASSITHNNGTRIKVPQNSFVNKKGEQVVGDVTLEYREFHDVGDIILSGIPMAYDSAGKKYHLESAGMFDIRGYQNGEPIFISPDKNLSVELASKEPAQRFNQYYLDTMASNWMYLQKDKAIYPNTMQQHSIKKKPESSVLSNSRTQALEREITQLIPSRIDSTIQSTSKKIANLPLVIAVPSKPIKANPSRPNFKLEGSYDEFPELAAFSNLLFEVGNENKNYSKDVHSITWSDVKISEGPVKGKNYLLTLSYRNRTEKLIVYPVFADVDFEIVQRTYEQKLSTYQAKFEKRQNDEKRLLAEMEAKQAAFLAQQKLKQQQLDSEKAKLMAGYDYNTQKELAYEFNALNMQTRATRIFSVTKFGIYNSDYPHNIPQGASIKPIFVLQDNEKILIPDAVYFVDHNTKNVYQLNSKNAYHFQYNPENTYSICVFQKNKIFICGKEAFKQAAVAAANKFIIKPLADKSDNLIEFKKALEI